MSGLIEIAVTMKFFLQVTVGLLALIAVVGIANVIATVRK